MRSNRTGGPGLPRDRRGIGFPTSRRGQSRKDRPPGGGYRGNESPRPRHANVETPLASHRPMCAIRRSCERSDERREYPEDDRDDRDSDEVDWKVSRGNPTADDREQQQKQDDRDTENPCETDEVDARRIPDDAAADPASHIPLSPRSISRVLADLGPTEQHENSRLPHSLRAKPREMGLDRPR